MLLGLYSENGAAPGHGRPARIAEQGLAIALKTSATFVRN